MTPRTIALLVGSTRTGSLNVRLARAIEKLAPAHLTFKWVRMDDLPFYNADLEGDRPDTVKRFVSEVESADAVCIVTPEYNRSIPAVLKNAIDWGSKPNDRNVWKDTVVAMTGATPGSTGTALAQQDLRKMLAIANAVVMPGEVYITFKTPDMIDDQGVVADDRVRPFLQAFVERFAALVERMAA